MDAVIRAGGRSCIRGRLPSLVRSLYPLLVLPQALHDRRSLQPRHLKRRGILAPRFGEPHRIHLLSKRTGRPLLGVRVWRDRGRRVQRPGCRPPTICRQGRRRTVIRRTRGFPARSRPLRQRLCGRRCRYLDRADPTGDHADSAATRSAQAAPRGFDHGDRTDQSRLPQPAPCRVPPNGSRRSRIGSGPCATDC